MPARTFVSASNPLITCALGANNFIMGPGTIAAIVRKASDGANHFILHAGPNSGTTRWCLGISTANLVFLRAGSADSAGLTTVTAADGWAFIAAAKATGTVAAGIHIYKYSTNAWVHETASTAIANGTAPTTATYIGANATGSIELNGDLAICGAWNVVLTNAQIESLAFNLNSWFSVQPRCLYVLDQDATTQALPDQSGNGANQTATTGTTISTSSVPVFSYGFDEIEADVAPSATSVAVPPGGASAGGYAPTAQIAVAVGGAILGGYAPATTAPVPQGGAQAAGLAPNVQTVVAPGGAQAAGASPVSQVALAPGGTLAAGLGATAAVPLTQGGAIVSGLAPTDGAAPDYIRPGVVVTPSVPVSQASRI